MPRPFVVLGRRHARHSCDAVDRAQPRFDRGRIGGPFRLDADGELGCLLAELPRKLVEAAPSDQPAGSKDSDPIAYRLDLAQEVRREQDRQATIANEASQEIEDLDDRDRSDRGRRDPRSPARPRSRSWPGGPALVSPPGPGPVGMRSDRNLCCRPVDRTGQPRPACAAVRRGGSRAHRRRRGGTVHRSGHDRIAAARDRRRRRSDARVDDPGQRMDVAYPGQGRCGRAGGPWRDTADADRRRPPTRGSIAPAALPRGHLSPSRPAGQARSGGARRPSSQRGHGGASPGASPGACRGTRRSQARRDAITGQVAPPAAARPGTRTGGAAVSVVDRLRRPVERLRRPAARPGTEQGGQRAPRVGWPIVAAKELADDLLDARFYVLILILGLVGAGTVYFSSDAIRSSASQASGTPSLFLLMFLIGQEGSPIPPFYSLIGFLLPLIGIAFGFDAINGERAQGTLPRLLSQPIHRDDVINGKFAAGLAVIATILVALTALVAGIGIVRLGISPSAEDVLRLIAWLVVSIVYVGFWLSFATLCSVAFRRAASSVLVSIGLWLGVTLFADFLVSAVANFLAPAGANASTEAVVNNAGWSQLLSQLSPSYLYQEATVVLFNPSIRTIGVLLPSQAEQLQTGGVPSPLSIDQSLLLVWPQIVAIVALTVISFAVAYVLFLRQEEQDVRHRERDHGGVRP